MITVLSNPVERNRFLKFMAVGAFGSVIDFGIANLLTQFLRMTLVLAGIAPDEADALRMLPYFVAERTTITGVCEVRIP